MNGAETLANVSRSVATLWVGVMAGFFYAFSAVVMPGLSTADPAIAMEAMQAINASVRNIAFAVGFFGAPLACVAAMAHAAHRRDWPAGWMVLVGGSVYMIGAFGVTFLVNVPLNETLASLDPGLPENRSEMLSYIGEWSIWNNIRTVASVIAFAFILCSQVVSQSGSRLSS